MKVPQVTRIYIVLSVLLVIQDQLDQQDPQDRRAIQEPQDKLVLKVPEVHLDITGLFMIQLYKQMLDNRQIPQIIWN